MADEDLLDKKYQLAEATVDRFVRRFGEPHRLLACHVALPLVLTPELVNYLRVRFLRGQVPWVAEADLLLSDLCRPAGYELYVMDTAVRAHLLGEMKSDPALGLERMQAVARLLIHYLRYLSRSNPYLARHELQAQQWAAMLYLEPYRTQAAGEIGESLRHYLVPAVPMSEAGGPVVGRAEMVALMQLTEILAPELRDFPELLENSVAISRMIAKPALEPTAKTRAPKQRDAEDRPGFLERFASGLGSLAGGLSAAVRDVTTPARATKSYKMEVRAYCEIMEGDDPRRVPLTLGSNTRIGRDPALSTIVLSDRSVSRLHARISDEGGNWFIYDEGSTSGTYVNYVMVPLDGQILADNDSIYLGRVELKFTLVPSVIDRIETPVPQDQARSVDARGQSQSVRQKTETIDSGGKLNAIIGDAERAYTYLAKRYGYGYRKIEIRCRIAQDGSAQVRRTAIVEAYSGISSLDTQILQIETSLSLLQPRSIRFLQVTSLSEGYRIAAESAPRSSASATAVLSEVGPTDPVKRNTYHLRVAPPLGSGDEIAYELAESLPPGVYAVGAHQAEVAGRIDSWDYFGWNVDSPMRRMSLWVYFPEALKPREYNCEIRQARSAAGTMPTGRAVAEEKDFLVPELIEVSQSSYALRLDVANPVLGRVYLLRWEAGLERAGAGKPTLGETEGWSF